MKITVEFSSWDELMEWKGSDRTVVVTGPFSMKVSPDTTAAETASSNAADVMPEPAGETKAAETALAPAEPKEEPKKAETPSYVLADIQKAVRDVVKAKGKDTAKEILGRFPHKDKKDAPAASASTVKPEDYAEAIAQLEGALNA